MTPPTLLVLFTLGGVWGTSFLFIKVVVQETSPLELVAGRLFFGAVAVILTMALRQLPLSWSPRLLAKVSLMAILSNVAPFALIAWAEIHIASGTASVLNSTMPLFTGIFAAAFLADEHFNIARLGGLILGFVGVVVLTGNDVVNITDSSVLGQLAVVGAAACYGAGAVYARTLLQTENPLSLSGLQLTVATLLTIPLVLAAEGSPDYSLSLKGWLSLLALGVAGTGLAYITYLWLISRVGSVRTSLVTYVIPVVGLLLGWAVLDEPLGANTALGTLLIVLGVASVMRGQGPAPSRPASAAVAIE